MTDETSKEAPPDAAKKAPDETQPTEAQPTEAQPTEQNVEPDLDPMEIQFDLPQPGDPESDPEYLQKLMPEFSKPSPQHAAQPPQPMQADQHTIQGVIEPQQPQSEPHHVPAEKQGVACEDSLTKKPQFLASSASLRENEPLPFDVTNRPPPLGPNILSDVFPSPYLLPPPGSIQRTSGEIAIPSIAPAEVEIANLFQMPDPANFPAPSAAPEQATTPAPVSLPVPATILAQEILPSQIPVKPLASQSPKKVASPSDAPSLLPSKSSALLALEKVQEGKNPSQTLKISEVPSADPAATEGPLQRSLSTSPRTSVPLVTMVVEEPSQALQSFNDQQPGAIQAPSPELLGSTSLTPVATHGTTGEGNRPETHASSQAPGLPQRAESKPAPIARSSEALGRSLSAPSAPTGVYFPASSRPSSILSPSSVTPCHPQVEEPINTRKIPQEPSEALSSAPSAVPIPDPSSKIMPQVISRPVSQPAQSLKDVSQIAQASESAAEMTSTATQRKAGARGERMEQAMAAGQVQEEQSEAEESSTVMSEGAVPAPLQSNISPALCVRGADLAANAERTPEQIAAAELAAVVTRTAGLDIHGKARPTPTQKDGAPLVQKQAPSQALANEKSIAPKETSPLPSSEKPPALEVQVHGKERAQLGGSVPEAEPTPTSGSRSVGRAKPSPASASVPEMTLASVSAIGIVPTKPTGAESESEIVKRKDISQTLQADPGHTERPEKSHGPSLAGNHGPDEQQPREQEIVPAQNNTQAGSRVQTRVPSSLSSTGSEKEQRWNPRENVSQILAGASVSPKPDPNPSLVLSFSTLASGLNISPPHPPPVSAPPPVAPVRTKNQSQPPPSSPAAIQNRVENMEARTTLPRPAQYITIPLPTQLQNPPQYGNHHLQFRWVPGGNNQKIVQPPKSVHSLQQWMNPTLQQQTQQLTPSHQQSPQVDRFDVAPLPQEAQVPSVPRQTSRVHHIAPQAPQGPPVIRAAPTAPQVAPQVPQVLPKPPSKPQVLLQAPQEPHVASKVPHVAHGQAHGPRVSRPLSPVTHVPAEENIPQFPSQAPALPQPSSQAPQAPEGPQLPLQTPSDPRIPSALLRNRTSSTSRHGARARKTGSKGAKKPAKSPESREEPTGTSHDPRVRQPVQEEGKAPNRVSRSTYKRREKTHPPRQYRPPGPPQPTSFELEDLQRTIYEPDARMRAPRRRAESFETPLTRHAVQILSPGLPRQPDFEGTESEPDVHEREAHRRTRTKRRSTARSSVIGSQSTPDLQEEQLGVVENEGVQDANDMQKDFTMQQVALRRLKNQPQSPSPRTTSSTPTDELVQPVSPSRSSPRQRSTALPSRRSLPIHMPRKFANLTQLSADTDKSAPVSRKTRRARPPKKAFRFSLPAEGAPTTGEALPAPEVPSTGASPPAQDSLLAKEAPTAREALPAREVPPAREALTAQENPPVGKTLPRREALPEPRCPSPLIKRKRRPTRTATEMEGGASEIHVRSVRGRRMGSRSYRRRTIGDNEDERVNGNRHHAEPAATTNENSNDNEDGESNNMSNRNRIERSRSPEFGVAPPRSAEMGPPHVHGSGPMPVNGMFIDVWWEDREESFRGRVVRRVHLRDRHVYFYEIDYDDGDHEEINLNERYWRPSPPGPQQGPRPSWRAPGEFTTFVERLSCSEGNASFPSSNKKESKDTQSGRKKKVQSRLSFPPAPVPQEQTQTGPENTLSTPEEDESSRPTPRRRPPRQASLHAEQRTRVTMELEAGSYPVVRQRTPVSSSSEDEPTEDGTPSN